MWTTGHSSIKVYVSFECNHITYTILNYTHYAKLNLQVIKLCNDIGSRAKKQLRKIAKASERVGVWYWPGLVVADGTCRPSVFVGSQQLSAQLRETRKKETSRPFDSSMSYPIDSSAVHINSATRPTERKRGRENSYRSSDFTIDIVTATGYRVDWDVLGSCSESPRDEIHERARISDTERTDMRSVSVAESPLGLRLAHIYV